MITVKELIAAQDKSISKLARDIGINPFTLRRISLREGKVKEITANKICKYFGINIKEVEEFQVLYDLGTSNKEKPRKKKASPKVKKKTKTKELKTKVAKQDPCPNHNCPFCKNDLCTNDIVNGGIAGCASKGVHKDKENKCRIMHPNGKVGITVVKNARKARKEKRDWNINSKITK